VREQKRSAGVWYRWCSGRVRSGAAGTVLGVVPERVTLVTLNGGMDAPVSSSDDGGCDLCLGEGSAGDRRDTWGVDGVGDAAGSVRGYLVIVEEPLGLGEVRRVFISSKKELVREVGN
jgi:hypothetical protein